MNVKMKDEYIIVNRTAIENRIAELEEWSKYNEKVGEYDSEGVIASELKELVSQSTPLIPEIEALNIANVSGSLLIPISTLKDWIDKLDSMEWSLNNKIYVKDDIEELVKNAEKQ